LKPRLVIRDCEEGPELLVVVTTDDVTTEHVERAWLDQDAWGKPAVGLGLSRAGREAMKRLTGDHVNEHIAQVINGEVVQILHVVMSTEGVYVTLTGPAVARRASELVQHLNWGTP